MARRIRVLLHLLNFYKETGGPQEGSLTLLLSSIYQHAQFLTQDKVYKLGGNHGLRQDWGVLAAVFAIPEFRHSPKWQELALSRMMEKQIDISFSSEGVYLEHSPGYHYYTILMIKDIVSLLKANGYQKDLSWVETLFRRSNYYLTHVLTPLGKFPPVGDSSEHGLERNKMQINDPGLIYAATSGREGDVPEDLDGFFPIAGQAIFRDSWGTNYETARKATYIHMHAANHLPNKHRHADELSFVMHAFGRWWILEAGKYAYERNEWREYVWSTQAHNSYTFNGMGLEFYKTTKFDKDVYFEDDFVSNPLIAAARAHSYRFAESGVSVIRTFIFLREWKTLVILDHLTSPKKGKWEAYLHLAPDLEVSVNKLQVLAKSPDNEGNVLEITSESGITHGIRLVKGQKNPILGWYSPKYLEIIPSPALVMDRTGQGGVASTVLRFRKINELSIENIKTNLTDDGFYEISWVVGGKDIGISVSKGQPLRVQMIEGS